VLRTGDGVMDALCRELAPDAAAEPVLSADFAGFKQAVQMDDHIFHGRVINRALGIGPPCGLCRREIREDSDDVQLVWFGEIKRLGISDSPTENEM
jgi:hypothetical protein